MEESSDVMEDECAEVLVRTRGDDPKRVRNLGEAENAADSSSRVFSSFETLVRTVLALEDDPRDEHSYAYSEKKRAFVGKEKDHCYSTYSKLTHRRVQSLSDENLYRSIETQFPEDSSMVLPHYQSNDSALDVTGFDTISEKCLSYDNINVKTVDVVTEKCILPGFSDPDISKMTLKNDENVDRPKSVPSSPPSKDQQLSVEHSYFKSFSSRKTNTGLISSQGRTSQQVPLAGGCIKEAVADKSPLFDHSYDTSQKRKSLPGNTGIKRGRSSEKINSFNGHHNLNSADLTKSPFLDHTYQSCELRNDGKRYLAVETAELPTVRTDKSDKFRKLLFSSQLMHDHAYERVGDEWVKRSRSCSMSETNSTKKTGLKTDHSYTYPNDSMCMEDDGTTSDSSLSDSGTESLNEDDEENALTLKSLDTYLDHSYVSKMAGR